MPLNYAAELSVWQRFGVLGTALAVSYLLALFFVYKYQGGLYPEHDVPSVVTPAMRKARLFFVFVCFSIAAIAGGGAFMLHGVVSPDTWTNFVWPALGGVGFAMLYGVCTRFDRIRPRGA